MLFKLASKGSDRENLVLVSTGVFMEQRCVLAELHTGMSYRAAGRELVNESTVQYTYFQRKEEGIGQHERAPSRKC